MNSIFKRFEKTAISYPECIALEINNKRYSYDELYNLSNKVASVIYDVSNSKHVGILAYRSFSTYLGVLGSLAAGKCYIPFNPKFPLDRIKKIIELTGCHTFVVGKEFYPIMHLLMEDIKLNLNFILLEDSLTIQSENHNIFNIDDINKQTIKPQASNIEIGESVYLLFTSGSTGIPKGIEISHSNLNSYLDFVQKKYPLCPDDRCSQAFDTTFDPSQHDIWTTWSVGATLVVIPQVILLNPAKFIIEKELTVWYSVPTVANMMRKMKSIKPNTFPKLRYSIFSGEALPADLAEDWQKAAPNSKLINYYGPTEVTINITDYLWNNDSKHKSINNITPLGKIFHTHLYKIVSDDMKEVTFGSEGELIISGPQVASGYFNDTEKTNQNFIDLEKRKWYRTGDLVKEDDDNIIYFLGRIDHQIQIRGYRVELQEIESVVKQITKVNQVVAIPYPVRDNIAEGITCFIEDEIDMAVPKIIQLSGEKLPDYMVPKAIVQIKKFPENINGKIDRKKLYAIIDEKNGTK